MNIQAESVVYQSPNLDWNSITFHNIPVVIPKTSAATVSAETVIWILYSLHHFSIHQKCHWNPTKSWKRMELWMTTSTRSRNHQIGEHGILLSFWPFWGVPMCMQCEWIYRWPLWLWWTAVILEVAVNQRAKIHSLFLHFSWPWKMAFFAENGTQIGYQCPFPEEQTTSSINQVSH